MRYPLLRLNQGFTLIELSIVLVIIGLIVGGILTGRDLIHAAEIRATISQHDKFEAAVNTFQGKYNCLPGDCAKADVLGVGAAGTGVYGENGDGNGVIGNTNNELANFWYHLSKANLISFVIDPAFLPDTYPIACMQETYPSSPCLPFSATSVSGYKGGWWISPNDTSSCNVPNGHYTLGKPHYWWLSGVVGGNNGDSAVLIPIDAFAIDSKIDDGLPLSGTVLAAGNENGDPCGATDPSVGAGGASSDTCVNSSTTPNTYNSQDKNHNAANLCSLLIGSTF